MDLTAAIPHVWRDARAGLPGFDTRARALLGEGRLRMASRNDGKDFTMASKDSSRSGGSSSKAQEQESNKKSKGQKTSSERGTATDQKKSPGKRPQPGSSSR